MKSKKVDKKTDAITKSLYGFSGIFLTIHTPVNAPTKIKGNNIKSNTKVLKFIVSQKIMWKGTFIIFTKRKNHAAVPMNLFFSKPIDRKYTDIMGPAAFPTIVINPPINPTTIERNLFLLTSSLITVIIAPEIIIKPSKTLKLPVTKLGVM